jgi:hypothetical protein
VKNVKHIAIASPPSRPSVIPFIIPFIDMKKTYSLIVLKKHEKAEQSQGDGAHGQLDLNGKT